MEGNQGWRIITLREAWMKPAGEKKKKSQTGEHLSPRGGAMQASLRMLRNQDTSLEM